MLEGATVETPLRLAAEFAERTGAVFIHPFDHPDVIAGQGTLGLEILDEIPDVDTIVVGIGGGGLVAGVAAPSRRARRADGPHRARHRRAGRELRRLSVVARRGRAARGRRRVPTIADGIAVARPGDLPFEIIRELVDEVVTVSEDDIARALLVLLERAKQVVEPAGAVGVAAILAGQGARPTDRPSRCSRAATSTRCCCSASSRTGSRHPVAT